MKHQNVFASLALYSFLLFKGSIALNWATDYQKSAYKWELWDPEKDLIDMGTPFCYETHRDNPDPILYRGIRGGPAVTESRFLENGHIFEGEEVDVAEPMVTFDFGSTFAITFWIYLGIFD